MITNMAEYRSTQEAIRSLEDRLERLHRTNPPGSERSKGLVKAGIHRMIAKLHQKMAIFLATAQEHPSDSEEHVSIEETE